MKPETLSDRDINHLHNLIERLAVQRFIGQRLSWTCIPRRLSRLFPLLRAPTKMRYTDKTGRFPLLLVNMRCKVLNIPNSQFRRQVNIDSYFLSILRHYLNNLNSRLTGIRKPE